MERLIRTLRREYLDQVVIFGEALVTPMAKANMKSRIIGSHRMISSLQLLRKIALNSP